MSWWDAAAHVPDKPTYAIRIFSSYKIDAQPLQESSLYKKVSEYTFDDNDTHPFIIKGGDKWLDEGTARKIVEDFRQNMEGVEALLVHCSRGENRSPAVAMALSELFDLGHDPEELKKKYDRYNHFVFDMLMRVGKEKQ